MLELDTVTNLGMEERSVMERKNKRGSATLMNVLERIGFKESVKFHQLLVMLLHR